MNTASDQDPTKKNKGSSDLLARQSMKETTNRDKTQKKTDFMPYAEYKEILFNHKLFKKLKTQFYIYLATNLSQINLTINQQMKTVHHVTKYVRPL